LEGSIENLGKGNVISVPFPFSDASATKRRPALVIAESDSNNIMVCPITSKPGRKVVKIFYTLSRNIPHPPVTLSLGH
jgi:mRNA-degrading endonuclease toxin of MazEF toxin-antitoxin module